jgi:transglutaminase-like putative cysteine protease
MPTVAVTCPPSNDMAALDVLAPGAAGTAKIGQNNLGTFGGIAGAMAGATATPQASPDLACRALAPSVEAGFAAIAAQSKTIPADGYDENARGQELADANAVFAFVRDRIRTEAYAGVMRGGLGTLMSRGGSPADKALLLAQLLATKGIAVRFVHAPLADADVQKILAVVLSRPKPGSSTRTAEKYDDGIQSAQTFTTAIAQTLAHANIAMPQNDAALRTQWTSNLRDHWWVQAQQGTAWVDMDPTLPGTQPGTHIGPNPTDPPALALPDDLYTTITLRVVADFTGSSSPQTLIERTAKAADAYAQPVSIEIGDPAGTLATLGTSTAFAPSITLAGGTQAGDSFTPDPQSGPRLLRLRLEVETDRPGYPALVQRQTIVDRSNAAGTDVDPSWTPKRTSFALTTAYYGLAAAGNIDRGFTLLQETAATGELDALLEYVANNQKGTLPPEASQTYPMEALHYFALDQQVRHSIEASTTNDTRFFFNRPIIAFAHHVVDWNGSQIVARTDFDVVESAMDADGTAMPAAVADNMTRGVAEDALEAHVVLPAGSPPITTRAIFSAASDAHVPLVAAASSGSPPQISTQAQPALADSVTRADVVAVSQPIVIDGASHAGWWEIDPQTGSTLGRLESGAGQAIVEYLPLTDTGEKARSIAEVVGSFDRCMYGGVDDALAGAGGGKSVGGCAQVAACAYLGIMQDEFQGFLDDPEGDTQLAAGLMKIANQAGGIQRVACGG